MIVDFGLFLRRERQWHALFVVWGGVAHLAARRRCGPPGVRALEPAGRSLGGAARGFCLHRLPLLNGMRVGRQVPSLRLYGLWLEGIGFAVGGKVRITMANGTLLIQMRRRRRRLR
ncbi:SymE family type I addiction module toxin [uncultured Xanthomonas sp.]|uniref:SymE family type I addiction module toxin n=1 Tax=uncultured Xanthomonas sp. TaxID=152831 RepID=UPI0025FB496E|nr:SymE family type I addiction module toxin [uncultured Xanthomonas sp.]